MEACQNNININILKLLINNNADINAVDIDKNSGLHYVCKHPGKNVHDELKIIEFFLDNGISVNCQNSNNDTPLHLAVQNLKPKTLLYLIKKGANVNSINNNRETPLHCVYSKWCRINKFMVTKLLLENRADVNIIDNNGNSILHNACSLYDTPIDIFELLLENNLSINCQNKDNNSPLHLAIQHLKPQTIPYLIKRGANVNSVNNEGQTPLHCCIEQHWVRYNPFSLTKLLLEKGADVNIIDNNRNSALHIACSTKSTFLSIIRLLVENNSTINYQNKDNDTALQLAVKNGNQNIVNYLFEKGVE